MTPDFLGVVTANAELCAWLILIVVDICLECHNITYISRTGCIQQVIRFSPYDSLTAPEGQGRTG